MHQSPHMTTDTVFVKLVIHFSVQSSNILREEVLVGKFSLNSLNP